MTVIGEIADERHRHITVEQWTPEHDDGHVKGEMAQAAACYAGYASGCMSLKEVEGAWPWGQQWWKPSENPRRDYIKAAALLVAEIERLDRRDLQEVLDSDQNINRDWKRDKDRFEDAL